MTPMTFRVSMLPSARRAADLLFWIASVNQSVSRFISCCKADARRTN